MQWCWRCKIEVPMLDDDEFEKAQLLYSEGLKNIKGNLNKRQKQFKNLLEFYFELTGYHESEPNAIMHHQISQYGPPCEDCGKPYRTPNAKFCAACGHKRD